jgi:gluconate 5-dehydrogenase
MDLFSLKGRTALVTGAARGLGLEIAKALAGAGAHVLVNGRDGDALTAAVEEVRAAGGTADPIVFDVTDDAGVTEALSASTVDILVNNVGRRDRRAVEELTPADMAALLDTDVISAYRLSRIVALRLVERGAPGRIVNISSVLGQLGKAFDPAYGTAKSALDGMTRALAAEFGRHAITVNAVAPGTMATHLNTALSEDPGWVSYLRKRVALGRWGRPEEVAGAVVFLASDAASYVTGHTLNVDGGMVTTFHAEEP